MRISNTTLLTRAFCWPKEGVVSANQKAKPTMHLIITAPSRSGIQIHTITRRHLVQLRNVLREPADLLSRQQLCWNMIFCAGSYLACPSDSFSQVYYYSGQVDLTFLCSPGISTGIVSRRSAYVFNVRVLRSSRASPPSAGRASFMEAVYQQLHARQ